MEKRCHELFALLLNCERELLRQEMGQFAGGEMAALFYLHFHHDGVSSAELGKYLEVSPSRMVAIAKSMVRKKYVTQQEDPCDRRIIRLYISDSGARLVADMYQRSLQDLAPLLDYLGEHDSVELIRILSRMLAYEELDDRSALRKVAGGPG